MICVKCGQRQATTEIIQRYKNHVEKLYLCSECARDYRPEVFDDFEMLDKLINGSPMGLLSGFSDFFNTNKAIRLVCPDCKTSSDEFLKSGYVGCPKCYEIFEPLIRQTVKKLQQADRHVGKRPYGVSGGSGDVALLRAEIQEALDSGNYSRVNELSKVLEKLEGNGGL
ncbi:MAG: hypothetical protein J1G38_03630 [Clostridiales bacterium]|nr:hypothetical protein [Clostridiales bacterium]